ncbi:MAG: SCO family protein [Woeseiaceae bacterium]
MQFLLVVLLLVAVPASADTPPELGTVTTEFALLNRDGDIVHLSEFLGQNVLVTFGFTNCAHICPMIAANMASAIRASDKDAMGIFISVDTERDSPQITDDYARKFSNWMFGFSGSHQQVSEAAINFNVTFVVTKSQDNYTVQHTPSIFLVGPDGQLIDTFAMNTPPDDIAAAMQ